MIFCNIRIKQFYSKTFIPYNIYEIMWLLGEMSTESNLMIKAKIFKLQLFYIIIVMLLKNF